MNVKYQFLLLPLFLLLTACSPDPVDTTGSISGTIRDAFDNSVLQGVTITLSPSGRSTVTGTDGYFQFSDVEQGEYAVSVNRADYVPDSKKVTVHVGQNTPLDFSMMRAGSALEVSPLTLDFGETDNQLNLNIKNNGQAKMFWQITENTSWVTCSQTSGEVLAGKTGSVAVIIDRTQLSKGTYTNTLVVTSNDGGSQTVRFTVTVSSNGDGLPLVAIIGVDGVTDVAATLTGVLTSIGSSRVTAHGFCWSTTPAPTIENNKYVNLGQTNEPKERFSYSVSGLSPNVTYYVRAFAINEAGTVYSSREERFTTTDTPQCPEVQTGAVTQLTSISAKVAGNILNLGHESGITEHGHVWSDEVKQPTINNSLTKLGTKKQTGAFLSELKNLKPNRTYNVRAYAINELGISYGDVVQFTTLFAEVKLITKSVSDVIHNEATCGGKISDLGGNTITERGVCWSTSRTPTLANNYSASTDNTNDFSARMTNLTAQTKYYVRAYVKTNSGETYYGQEIQFTTTQEVFLPQASVTTITNISAVSVTASAFVLDNGNGTVKDKGFCYSTSPYPTVVDKKYSCGKNASSFTTNLSGLNENTHYYIRAYVVNECGTGYGEQMEFQTLQLTRPVLSGVNITGISFRAATFDASVESLGNGTLKRSGFCYAMSHNPTINNKVVLCDGKISLKASVSALDAETTYYVRAFAENEKGISYGEEKSFTTLEGSNVKKEDWGDDDNWNF